MFSPCRRRRAQFWTKLLTLCKLRDLPDEIQMDFILLTALTVGWSSAPPIVATRQFATPSVLAFQPAKWRCGAVRLSAEQDDAASPPAADPAIEALVRDELAALAELEGEAQEAALPGLLQRVQERAAAERVPFEDGYKFGDVSKTEIPTDHLVSAATHTALIGQRDKAQAARSASAASPVVRALLGPDSPSSIIEKPHRSMLKGIRQSL